MRQGEAGILTGAAAVAGSTGVRPAAGTAGVGGGTAGVGGETAGVGAGPAAGTVAGVAGTVGAWPASGLRPGPAGEDEALALEELIDRVLACTELAGATKLLFSIQQPSARLERAVEACVSYHEGQRRKSGEDYAVHPILVSCFVSFLSQHEANVIAALLHDVIEDTHCSEEELRGEFGPEVARLVLGLTKITEIREERLAGENENLAKSALSFRNMMLASTEDIGVLLIKLCDRLHNMLTLNALSEAKQKRISEETLVVYAPIAHRLGISSIKNYLEDLSFKYLLPQEYAQIHGYIHSNDLQMQLSLNEFIAKVGALLAQNGFAPQSFTIQKRIKHCYSIYLKMQRKGVGLEEVLDLLGIRILVRGISECYLVLGILHTHFNPLISRFKDYIALPKQNGYQTIHTTLFDSKNIIEAQIRSFDMHKIAEFGVAAHWRYKSGEGGGAKSGGEEGVGGAAGANLAGAVAGKTVAEDAVAEGAATGGVASGAFCELAQPRLEWLSDLSAQQDKDLTAIDLYEYAKDSLFIEDIAVYSPKGEIFTLPRGATVLDFAYEVHTKVGLHAKSAYVNRIKVPLLTELKNGDIVRVITAEERRYRCSWIDSVKTGKARANMREFCRQKVRELSLANALNILGFILGVEASRVSEWVARENLGRKIRQAVSDLGYLRDVVAVLKKYAKRSYFFEKYELKEQRLSPFLIYSNHKISSVNFEYCCQPKRGDAVMAFASGSGAAVHHRMCEKAEKMLGQDQNMLFIKWDASAPKPYKIIFTLENKRGSLAEFLGLLAKMQINVLRINLSNNQATEYFEALIEMPENLAPEQVRARLKGRHKILDFTSLNDAYKED